MRALGTRLLAFDDHPGQLARLVLVVRDPRPWAWHSGWWAGYAEMQFYPPGWFYAGAVLSWVSLGAITPFVAYSLMVWVTYLAPGVSVYLLLRRILGDAWAALPGAFVVLAFSGDPAGGNASGVEGGVHIGMVAARLAWAMLPVLALSLREWTAAGGRFPRAAIFIVAAIVLTHPAHVPAALAILVGAALLSPSRWPLAQVAGAMSAALGLAAFWLVPLLAHLSETRALAWGSLGASGAFTPLGALLGACLLVAVARRRNPPWSAAVHAAWLGVAAVAMTRLVLEPLGARFLPSDRVADGVWLLLLVVSGLGLGALVQMSGSRVPSVVVAGVAVSTIVVCALPGRTLALWPRPAEWPDQRSITRGLRLDDLWRVLRDAPPGRVLFLRSGVPLVYGTDWYRPHTHVTALAPILSGRDIVGGTFTHGSPVAAFIYRGDAGPAPLTRLAEQLDGRSLFGRALDSLDAADFAGPAERLRIAAVVTLEDDAGSVRFLDDARYHQRAVPPFLVFIAREAPPSVRALGGGRWTADLDGMSPWRSAGVAYSPLWRVEHAGRAVAARRGPVGDLEVNAPPSARSVDLTYRAGPPEFGGLAASVLALAALGVDRLRRRAARR